MLKLPNSPAGALMADLSGSIPVSLFLRSIHFPMASIHFPMAALSTAAGSTASDSSSAREKGNSEHTLWGKQSERQIIPHLSVPVLPAAGEDLSHSNTQMRPQISAFVLHLIWCSFKVLPSPLQYLNPWNYPMEKLFYDPATFHTWYKVARRIVF